MRLLKVFRILTLLAFRQTTTKVALDEVAEELKHNPKYILPLARPTVILHNKKCRISRSIEGKRTPEYEVYLR